MEISAFEKHTSGILPRAGHHATVIVEEDIAHVETPMGLIGIRIRIAKKEKLIPEFEMTKDKSKKTIAQKPQMDVKEITEPEQISNSKANMTEEEQVAKDAALIEGADA